MKKITDPLAGIGRQASKLLHAQSRGRFPQAESSILTRSEVEILLRDPSAEQKWVGHTVALQLPHSRHETRSDEITSAFFGGASLPATRKHYIPLVCDLAADALAAHLEVAVQKPDQLRTSFEATKALYESNPKFKEILHDFINAKYLDSYVAKLKYGLGLASLSVRGEDILSLIASLDPEANADAFLQFGSIIRVQKAIPDPRHFAEKLVAVAAEKSVQIDIQDVMCVAYLLYQKRFEYIQAVLDLRQRIGLVTNSVRESSAVERAMASTDFSLHQRNILLYGKAQIELAIIAARRLGMALEQTVHIDPPQANRKAGTIIGIRPSSYPARYTVEVRVEGEVKKFDLYALEKLQVKSTGSAS